MVGAVRPPVKVLTWNLQGSHDLDVPAAAAVLRQASADVIALQEVQRRQAARLAAALSVGGRRWVLKHWPIVHRAEGLALITAHRIVRAHRFVLSRGAIWRWQRRVGLDATVDIPTIGAVRVLDVHLSPHELGSQREREAQLILARARCTDVAPIIVGDLNEPPGGGAVAALAAAGWLDAWLARHGDAPGATNWTGGDRAGRAPSQRIDYVLPPPGSIVHDAVVIDRTASSPGAADLDGMGSLSDHLPLLVTLRLPEAR